MPARAELRRGEGPLARAFSGLAGAIGLLTVVPLPRRDHTAGWRGAAAWFPVVGAAVGAAAAAVRLALDPLLGRSVANVLALVALVAVTGGLHQDGLADTADGLGARGSRERRLEVMRDPAVGVFGALALIAWALTLLAILAQLDGERTLRALVTAGAAARWAAVVHAAGAPPARLDGLGAAFSPARPALLAATALTAAIALPVGGPGPGGAALAATLAVAVLCAAFARRMLGGRTGDTLGATVAIAEVSACAAALAVWRG